MDGILLVDKPKGVTSYDIVRKVKKILNTKTVGHTGTLDPNATGLLPLLINKGTKLSKYLIEHDKTYIATLQLGIKTDTMDSEGRKKKKKTVSKEIFKQKNVISILNSFIGVQEQIPPIYSALKINGKKLYEYARKNQKINIADKKRNIEIYSIELKQIDEYNEIIVFKVHCSKGTYIRSLCEDIAVKLGTIGYMKELRRLTVGKFSIEQAIENLSEIENHIISIEEFFNDKYSVYMNENKIKLLLNGVKLNYKEKGILAEKSVDGVYKIYSRKIFIGTGIMENGFIKRDIILKE